MCVVKMEILCHSDLTNGACLGDVNTKKLVTVDADSFDLEYLRELVQRCAISRATNVSTFRNDKWNGRISSYGNLDGGWRPVTSEADWMQAKVRAREKSEVLRLVYFVKNNERPEVHLTLTLRYKASIIFIALSNKYPICFEIPFHQVLPSKEFQSMMKPNEPICVPHLTHGKINEKLNMLYLVRHKKSTAKDENSKIAGKQLSMASELENKLIRTRW